MLVSFVAGMALRAWQLDIQILIDDEWHAVHRLLRASASDIATHLGYADYSIPLTLYYQGLYRTIGLSEWGMHVPPLLAGIGLLLVGPRLLARSFALPSRAIWTSLVAISPLLVYHSKVARPYALTSLATFVAIIAFRAWWLDGRRRDAALYVVATVLSGWLHPVTLPFTLLPFAYYALRASRPFDPRRLRALAIAGLVTAAAVALVLLPPLVIDWTEFSHKAGRDVVTAASAYRTALMLAGTGSPWAAAIVAVTAVIGFRAVLRRDRDLAWYLASTLGVAGAVVASSGAEWISHPLVLARYLLPAVPFLLLFSAEGIAVQIARFGRAPAAVAASAALAAALFVAGPIPAEWHYPNQFWGHLRYQFDYDPEQNPYVQLVPKDPVPAFYAELGKRPPGSVTLIETPWRLESHFNPQPLYQDVHHQLITIGLATPVCGASEFGHFPPERTGMTMRRFVHLSAVLRGETAGADYLVVHVTPRNMAADPGALWPDVAACMPAIEAALGPPVFRDDQMVVFALARVSPLGNTRRTVQQ